MRQGGDGDGGSVMAESIWWEILAAEQGRDFTGSTWFEIRR